MQYRTRRKEVIQSFLCFIGPIPQERGEVVLLRINALYFVTFADFWSLSFILHSAHSWNKPWRDCLISNGCTLTTLLWPYIQDSMCCVRFFFTETVTGLFKRNAAEARNSLKNRCPFVSRLYKTALHGMLITTPACGKSSRSLSISANVSDFSCSRGNVEWQHHKECQCNFSPFSKIQSSLAIKQPLS